MARVGRVQDGRLQPRRASPAGLNPFSRTHKNYTAAIVSSDFDVPFYAEAFGIPEERVVPTGIPRMDRFFDEAARAAGVEAARAAFPEIVGRETILFAPTFAARRSATPSYDFEHLDYAALHALCVETRRGGHHQDAPVRAGAAGDPRGVPRPAPRRIRRRDRRQRPAVRGRPASSPTIPRSCSSTRPSADRCCSSPTTSTSTSPRRDFYVPFESFVPGRIVRTFPDLLDAIRREDYEVEKVAAFATRHFAHLDGGSTDRVIDELIVAP